MEKLQENEYQCELCKGIFTKGRSDEETEAEARKNFGEEIEDPVVICDDCYNAVTIGGKQINWN